MPPDPDDDVLAGELISASEDSTPSEIVPVREVSSSGLATVSTLDRFMARIRRYAVLSADEERALALRAQKHGDGAAARRLVLHNLRLVVSIAYEFRRAWSNVMDLVQEGSVGLVEAVGRWDPTRGARFGTYAAYWIRAYVLRYVLNNFRLVHVGNTRAGRKLFFQLERERQKLLTAGIEPTDTQLADRLGVLPAEVREVAGHLAAPEIPLDTPQDSDGNTLSNEVASGDSDPESRAGDNEAVSVLQGLTRAFGDGLTDPRDLAVWREHILAEEPIPLSVLGTRFGVSKQRMGQVVAELKKRFREDLVRQMGPAVELSWLVDDTFS